MNLLEERLREGLDALADDASVGVRVEDLVAAGEGVRLQRTIRRSIAGVAAAVLAGIGGWFALSPHPMTVQPAPLATPSVSASTAEAFLGFDEETNGVYHLVSIRTERTGDSLTVRVTDEPAGGQPVTREFRTQAGRYFTAKVHDNLAIAVIPEVATRVLQLGRHEGHAESHWQVPAAGVTLVGLWGPTTDVPADLVWLNADGVVSTASGTVPSVRLELDGQFLTVFQGTHGLGLFSSIFGAYPVDCCSEPGTEYRTMVPGMLGESLGLLPAGARDVQVTTTHEAEWTVGSLPGGPTVWFVHATTGRTWDASRIGLVKQISYTDTTGTRVTFTPKLEG